VRKKNIHSKIELQSRGGFRQVQLDYSMFHQAGTVTKVGSHKLEMSDNSSTFSDLWELGSFFTARWCSTIHPLLWRDCTRNLSFVRHYSFISC